MTFCRRLFIKSRVGILGNYFLHIWKANFWININIKVYLLKRKTTQFSLLGCCKRSINTHYNVDSRYCQSTFIRCHWHQFSWFLQNVVILRFFNSWFQTLQWTINEKIVFRWIFFSLFIQEDNKISEN